MAGIYSRIMVDLAIEVGEDGKPVEPTIRGSYSQLVNSIEELRPWSVWMTDYDDTTISNKHNCQHHVGLPCPPHDEVGTKPPKKKAT